jgi:hypothetical protein
VTIATLTQWRDRFLAGGEAGMKSREVDVDDEENRRLKSVVANLRSLSRCWQSGFLASVASTNCTGPANFPQVTEAPSIGLFSKTIKHDVCLNSVDATLPCAIIF